MTTQDRASRITKLEEELEQLRAERRYSETLTLEQQVAEELHGAFCSSDHIDRCGWTYENWSSPGWTKRKYLNHAMVLLRVIGEGGGSVAMARRIIAALRGIS